MPEIILAPISQTNVPTQGIEREIGAYFLEAIFQPLFNLLENENVRMNAVGSAVVRALQDRQIWYADGTFSGKFNSSISRELRAAGASKQGDAFKLPVDKLSMEWRLAVQQSQQSKDQLNKKVLETLDQIQENSKQASFGLEFSLDGVFVDLNKQLKKTMQAQGVDTPPDLTEGVKADIEKEYTNNMELYIKDFVEKLIPEMRVKIQENIFAGGRTDKLAKIIETEYGVSKRKAAFLAEQETSLLVSKYRESRYKAAGSLKYVWSGSNDARERPDHKLLNGKVFYWDSPPITNRATGARNNPGEDFGCRCVARPILQIEED